VFGLTFLVFYGLFLLVNWTVFLARLDDDMACNMFFLDWLGKDMLLDFRKLKFIFFFP